ncbi:exodeoxyribonuclease V subunit beta [Vitreoscilla massiliensis]|uniref:RecBCD enzyme subunit RecB n=1 Tax=Vitreoscilla massiliensis TaxID=1689272 RepID=A0ABY4E235_9NEIS|nr:exodeoxyribonuclease V subunit beta [Vitreoscilla massiliensis]UOO89843.1 exodeoxyribonuclease V subunit beta [Vitreoscilla massiliensis]
MSHDNPRFLALDVPIAGTQLIEASAGTGKTWTIAALFLRLVLLEHMAVDKILVVTFTNAATAELKTRLRARLDDALRELQGLSDGDDAANVLQAAYAQRQDLRQHAPHLPEFEPFLFEILTLALAKEAPSRLRLRLQAAINQFDHAGIFTIHGFCQRVLREFAFLCQVPFQMELADDTSAAQLRLAADFWRQHVINDIQLATLCIEKEITPQSALSNIKKWFARTDLQADSFMLTKCQHSVDEINAQLQILADSLIITLPKLQTSFDTLLPRLDGRTYKSEKYQNLFLTLHELLPNQRWADLDKNHLKFLVNLGSEVLIAKTSKKSPPLSEDESQTFSLLTRIPELFSDKSNALQALFEQIHVDLWAYVLPKWRAEKQRLQQLGFDDLLTDVATALQNPEHGEALATRISEQMWQVALIDEFQDTDPLQYGIFNTIFRAHHKPVFLVGDPKQAIYRFRGADIHAYLQAKHDADAHHTLDTNRRTHQTLVNSVNALFLNKAKPFVLDNIDYIDVHAARAQSKLSPNAAPLVVQWLMQDGEDTLTKDTARQRAAEYCAADIARHLALSQQGKLHYQDGVLQAKHIAVLVRTHNEGEKVREVLSREHGISSVILSRDSVFKSAQAKSVLTLLQWWQNPQQQGLLRSVLASVLLAYRSSDLQRLNQVEHQAELISWMEDALAAQQIWQQRGIYAAWQMFDHKRGISADLLRRDDKRGLTNLQQLFELLAHEASERFGAESLLQWLSEQIAAAAATNTDSASLRLESDEELVKIVTMHASKGLEYPLVFCPFVWDEHEFKAAEFNLVHAADGSVSVVSKPCLSADDTVRLTQDDVSESLRLLYVALTRAAEKLVLSACIIAASKDNVLNYLITPEHDSDLNAVLDYWKTQIPKDSNDRQQWYRDLWQHWAQQHGIPLLWQEDMPAYAGWLDNSRALVTYQAAQAQLPFYRLQEYTSFSGISRHVTHAISEELVPEMDAAELQAASDDIATAADTPESENEFDIFHFQRGTEAGLCMHALLEVTDFTQTAASQTERYLPILEQYQIAPEWYAALYQMIDDTRLATLDADVNLAGLKRQQYLPEMGFVLRADDFNATEIGKWLQNSSLPVTMKSALQGVSFRDISGYLNGFIDLTCVASNGRVYVIDYKSNHLGMQREAYQTRALDHAITEHRYYLQALIYAIAVERYLQSRGFQAAGIHIRYLFLRGMQAESAQGIWRWDITASELEKLTPILAS